MLGAVALRQREPQLMVHGINAIAAHSASHPRVRRIWMTRRERIIGCFPLRSAAVDPRG